MSATAIAFDRPSERAPHLMLLPGTVGFYFAARLCLSYLFFLPDPQLGAEVDWS